MIPSRFFLSSLIAGLLAVGLIVVAPTLRAGDTAETKTETTKTDADPKKPEPIGPVPGVEPVEKVRGGYQFTEGPAWDGTGTLYFTDIPANRIYRWTDGNQTVFLEPSGHCNGLMFTGAGKFYGCQMDGQLVSFDPRSKQVTVIAKEYEGKRFNAPNDLVIDSHGGVYFTDPRFRAPEPWPQGVEAVYYAAPGGRVTRLISDLKAPNGVILSPDEKTLYVVPSMSKDVMAYPVVGLGRLGEGRVFASLKQPEGVENSGGDGLTIDTKGRLYITSRLGVQVFKPDGSFVGVIKFPEQPANVAFGGPDRKTLYVTARKGLYRAATNATGHVFPGKK